MRMQGAAALRLTSSDRDGGDPSCVPSLAARDRPRGAAGHTRRSEPAVLAARLPGAPGADHQALGMARGGGEQSQLPVSDVTL